ncbi:S-layer homology domain-containing protein [Paenibacillus cremeus]|uniref:SLH domain-containing protein n=1 Tax=Paenibacillus cremeus TaxID=2163881 RepID=A0A559K8A3_9BACL|nr:S-layer homology domain-containing protein [Paenibacillus cremeus]TVY08361.1 hypothetical protein FPZ49_19145 [Paenibacillus cremeus]
MKWKNHLILMFSLMVITITACSNKQYGAKSATDQQERILSQGGVPQQISKIRSELNQAKANISTNKTDIDTLKKENETLKTRLSAVESKFTTPSPSSVPVPVPAPTPGVTPTPGEKAVTRAEVSKFLVLSLGIYDEKAQANFTDVPMDNEYYSYIASAYNNGLIDGLTNGMFAPNNSVTREQYATILARGVSLPIPSTDPSITIKDIDTGVAAWASIFVQAVVNAGLMDLDILMATLF